MKQEAIASVSNGLLRGSLHGSAAVFLGIPYAAPPLGPLRWREPEPAQSWRGLRDATKPGSACIQGGSGVVGFMTLLSSAYSASYEGPGLSGSEDCLYLNVWAPEWKKQKKLPVMVWLHGGSNVMGSGSQATYDGLSLASHGVIVVSLNYRLGVLGFFSHPELSKESPHHASGNYGLLDQIAALKWVQENIAQFGGDPSNVTLFGESAGGIDAVMLMTSPLSAKLFRRVIAESGPGFGPATPMTLAQAEDIGNVVAAAAPGTVSSGLQRLRAMSATDAAAFLDRTIKMKFPQASGAGTVDGWALTQPAAQAFARGQIQPVDLIAGMNGREMSVFLLKEQKLKASPQGKEKSTMSSVAKGMGGGGYPLYGNWALPAMGLYLGKAILGRSAALEQAGSDMILACPIGAEASLTSAAGRKVFLYKFNRSVPGAGEGTVGAFHSIELPYVFNTFDSVEWKWLPVSNIDRALSGTIETYWTNFAKAGDPNSPGQPVWSAWSNKEESYLEFTKEGRVIAQRDFSPPFCFLSPERLKRQLGASK